MLLQPVRGVFFLHNSEAAKTLKKRRRKKVSSVSSNTHHTNGLTTIISPFYRLSKTNHHYSVHAPMPASAWNVIIIVVIIKYKMTYVVCWRKQSNNNKVHRSLDNNNTNNNFNNKYENK
jgi:hypothetical protein